MANQTWDVLIPIIAPDVYQCPNITVEIAIRDAAIEFCMRSKAWRFEHDPVAMVPGEAKYDFEPPSGAKIDTIKDMVCNGIPVQYRHPEQMSELSATWQTDTGSQPSVVTMFSEDQFRVYPIPTTTLPVAFWAIVKPSRTSTGMESTILETYAETLASGAKARLMAVPNKDWSNPALSEYHRAQFELGISKALVRDYHGASMKVKPRRFGS